VIENGFVHIPETMPWLAEYHRELTVVPNQRRITVSVPAVVFRSAKRCRAREAAVKRKPMSGVARQTG
jgi:hypothetical protein